MKFHEYYLDWVNTYKRGAVRAVTLQKYMMSYQWIFEIAPDLLVAEIDKRAYQSIMNQYAETHERQTTRDFHRHLKAAILDGMDEGLIKIDPTRRVVIKGKPPRTKKPKFLSNAELSALLQHLTIDGSANWDLFILLLAKTGLRFSEALGLTQSDFDFAKNKLTISKTWNYKDAAGGFAETKNQASKRTISIDSQLCNRFSELCKGITDANTPIFVKGRRIFNSTVNNRLGAVCRAAGVPIINIHSLRHTHASLLIFAGVSIASIARRLGHSNTTTTQDTYLHIIRELEDQDNVKIINHMEGLG
jgi:integrase